MNGSRKFDLTDMRQAALMSLALAAFCAIVWASPYVVAVLLVVGP